MSDASSNYSAVVEDILKLVWSAEEAGRDGVKPKDVSEHMGVVPSTATENIQRLARQGLVTHERYGRRATRPHRGVRSPWVWCAATVCSKPTCTKRSASHGMRCTRRPRFSNMRSPIGFSTVLTESSATRAVTRTVI